MAYKYKTLTRVDGTYIEYDIAPDLSAGGAFTTGDTIAITGVVHNRYGKFTGPLSLSMAGDGGSLYSVASTSFTSANGSDKTFTLSFSAPDLSTCVGSARAGSLELAFNLPTANTTISLRAMNRITYVKYRLEPNILDFRLERCNSSGAADNEGTYLRCAMLKLSKSAQASASDYSVCSFSWEAASGASGSFSATGPFSQALTSTGYRETGSPSANLFGTRQFLTTTDYNVTLTVGDAYDTYSATVVVPRAFAIIHFSGAANGGVAIGMFSSATDDSPMFEVAKNHETHFYGPVYFEGDVTGAGGGERGSKWFSGTALSGTSTSTNYSSSSLTDSYLVGDCYLNTGVGGVYRCVTAGTGSGAKWRYQGSIRGSDGGVGPAGPYFTPSVSSAGTLSWTNNGGLSNPSSVSIKGPQGSAGAKGDDGDYYYPSVSSAGLLSWTKKAGTASSSTPASVNIKGPKGDKGDTGPQGPQGPSGNAIAYKSGEVNTGNTWIDGKPIYRFVATTTNKLSATISGPSNVDVVISLYGAGKRKDGAWFPLPAVHSNAFNSQVLLQFNPSTYVITIGSAGDNWTGSSGPFIVIMEYTKA